MTQGPRTTSRWIACALCMLLTACAAQPRTEYVPVAVECPKPPQIPDELMRPLPTLDLIPVELLPAY